MDIAPPDRPAPAPRIERTLARLALACALTSCGVGSGENAGESGDPTASSGAGAESVEGPATGPSSLDTLPDAAPGTPVPPAAQAPAPGSTPVTADPPAPAPAPAPADVGTVQAPATPTPAEPARPTGPSEAARAPTPELTLPDAVDARVGDELTFAVVASSSDGSVPSLRLVDAPAGARLDDRGDGARRFRWTPSPDDVGEGYATFEARAAGERGAEVLAGDGPEPALTLASVLLRVLAVAEPARDGGDEAPDPGEPAPRPIAATSAFDDEPSLRTLAAGHGVLVGSAAMQNRKRDLFTIPDGERYREILTTEYDVLTPENSLKMSEVQPSEGDFRWDASDRIIDFAEANGMAVHGHPLLWHQQMPDWAEALGRASERDRMRAVMSDHIGTVMSRYAGRIAVWDVVNEALEEDGSLRHTPWYRGVGKDYVHEAFTLARAADPAAALIYNDYGIGWWNPKSTALHARLRGELERGTPIDGVGFQLHLVTEFTIFDSVRRNFRRFADLGLDIWITELDVATDWRLDPASEARRQADVYAEVVRICVEQPRCKGLQVWGLSDRYAWRGAVDALPLDDAMRPKPALYAMRRALQRTPAVPRRD